MKEPVFLERLNDGSFLLSSFKKGHLESRRYMGYNKKDAIRLFKNHLKKVI